MAAAPIVSPADYDRVFGPAEGFTKSFISAFEAHRKQSELNLPDRRARSRQLRRCDRAIKWLSEHEEALDAARARMDQEFKDLMLEFLAVCSAETPAWAYPVGCLVYAFSVFLVIPYIINSLYPPLPKADIINTAFLLHYLGLRIYFTFRSRILHHFGLSKTHSQALINIAAEGLTKVFAVGAAPFRAAPLAEAWAGLTGSERVQPSGERTMIMVLLRVTLLDFAVPLAISKAGQALIEYSRGDSVLSHMTTSAVALLTTLAYVAYLRLIQITVRACQLLAGYFGLRWSAKHPILRGFTNQLLATYFLPNPSRDQELLADAALAAEAVKG